MDDRMAEIREMAAEDAEVLKNMVEAVQKLAEIRGTVSNGPVSQISVNAGGVALWVAVTACAVAAAMTLVASIFFAISLSDINQQIREIRERQDVQQAYINAAFAQPKE